jgi:hypothetical protein
LLVQVPLLEEAHPLWLSEKKEFQNQRIPAIISGNTLAHICPSQQQTKNGAAFSENRELIQKQDSRFYLKIT